MSAGAKRKDCARGSAGWLVAAGALLIGLLVVPTAGLAQTPPASAVEPLSDIDVPESRATSAREVAPAEFRALLLNRDAMAAVLAAAPAEAGSADPLVLALPAPDGTSERFQIWRNNTMAPELAAEFPDITTFSGQGIDDPAATIAADLTPAGFHAQVLSPDGTWYIDPRSVLDDSVHLSYFRADYPANPQDRFVETYGEQLDPEAADSLVVSSALTSGTQKYTHRLAVAANSGYTTFFGGTSAQAQAAIVTAINRVSGIFKNEVAVEFQLVANNSRLVFAADSGTATCAPNPTPITNVAKNPTSGNLVVTTGAPHQLLPSDVVLITGTNTPLDGKWPATTTTPTTFTINDSARFFPSAPNPGASGTASYWTFTNAPTPTTNPNCDPFVNQDRDAYINQVVVDTIIGDASYDVGHMFNTSAGGLAPGPVGVSGQKAKGMTGQPSPRGDQFSVDYVAHELGHQYGADHTFNGCIGSGWWGPTAVEPGSGVTIMGYASLCGNDDLGRPDPSGTPGASIPYFHAVSIGQITTTLQTPPGNIGAAPSGNTPPTATIKDNVPCAVTAVTGPCVVVPSQTPFFMSGIGSDANGDALTYQWEQRNISAQRTLDNPSIPGPLYRSFAPTTNPTSFFPRLSDVAAGNTNQNQPCPALTGQPGPATCWSQFLVPVGTPNTSLNFRGTVRDNNATAGGLSTVDMSVVALNTGAKFAVTSPNTAGTLSGRQPISWSVAGTNNTTFGATNVSIRLSTDGGLTFPTELLANTANDGIELVNLPPVTTSTARIMVHSGTFDGRGFFDMSDQNFAIVPAGSDFKSLTPARVLNTRGGARVGNAAGTGAPVTLKVTGQGGVPASGVGAVALNVTVTQTENPTIGDGFVTVYPCGTRPDASNLNFTTGQTIPNSVIAPVSAAGTVCFYVYGTAHLLADVSGYFPSTSSFMSLTPARVLNTRGGARVGNAAGTGAPVTLKVTGQGGVPASGVGAVALNVTVTQTENPTIGDGFVTVYPCGTRPDASNLNFTTGQTIPNSVIAPVSAAGTVCFYVYGTAHLLADVSGYFPSTSSFMSLTPARVLNTRGGARVGNAAGTGAPVTLKVTGQGGVPASGVGAVALNVTVTQTENPTIGDGFVTVYPCGTRPDASNLNFTTGQTIPNSVIAPVSAAGTVCFYVYGTAHLLADVSGYFPS